MKIIAAAFIAATAFAGEARRSIEQLPRCQAANVSAPKEWKTVDLAGSNARFRVPADMQPLVNPKVFCIHGCEQWVRGTFKVSVSHGMWGPSSFEDEAWANACVAKRGALRVVQMPSKSDGHHAIIVWPANDTSTQTTQDIVLNIEWSDPEDEVDAKKVIASLR